MRYTRALVLGAALLTSGATFATAQAIVPVQWGWQHRDDDDRQAFRDGFQRGQFDAEHRRRSDWDDNCRYREADDRRAYHSGYDRGYREVNVGYGGGGYYGGDSDRDRDNGYGRGYGGYGGYGLNAARQYGYQDGLNDGASDRRTGHSFRPANDNNYKHADRGYDSRFGNKNDYKASYRQAYEQGYQQGYNGNSRRR